MHDLTSPAGAVTALLPAITDDQLPHPTPCERMDVGVLLVHLIGLSTAFTAAARKDLGAVTAAPPDPTHTPLPDDWRRQLPESLDGLVAAWREPAAWTGMTRAGGVDLPGDVCGLVAMDELVLHGWDLAQATGQRLEVDDATVRAAYDFLWPPQPQEQREGMFGPVVQLPDDAPLLDRLVGLGGRDPAWSPGR